MPKNRLITPAIMECLDADDPLSSKCREFVTRFREETAQLDFKLKPHNDERGWINLAIDVSSFANMYGGYLVFGVKDRSFDLVGISKDEADLIANVELIGQKLGSFLEPPIQTIRSKTFELDGRTFGIICTQRSRSTHIFKRDAETTITRKGKTHRNLVVQKGIIYIRTVTGNSRLDVASLSLLLDRRLEDEKDRLLKNIARVVKAPADADIMVSEKEAVTVSGITLTDDRPASQLAR